MCCAAVGGCQGERQGRLAAVMASEASSLEQAGAGCVLGQGAAGFVI